MEDVKIRFTFRESTEYGYFQDSLYFTESEFHSKSREELDALKQERIDAWVDIMKNPRPPSQETLADLRSQEAMLKSQLSTVIDLMEPLISVADLEEIKSNYLAKVTQIQNKIDDKNG